MLKRLWIYQQTRFPLKKNVPMLLVFSFASVAVSAHLGGRPLPDVWSFFCAFVLAFALFFQMRAADEWKDREIDATYRSHRPIPQGIVSLRLILTLGVMLSLPALMAAWSQSVVLLLVLTWIWLIAMTLEFGVKKWLVAHPLAYLLSHMMIMPFMDFLLTGVEWREIGAPPPGLVWFLLLSLLNGCVLEIGRKCWSPEKEQTGVESYSKTWGMRRAIFAWLSCVTLSAATFTVLGASLGFPLLFCALGLISVIVAGVLTKMYLNDPKTYTYIDTYSGIWILVCYAGAALLPMIG